MNYFILSPFLFMAIVLIELVLKIQTEKWRALNYEVSVFQEKQAALHRWLRARPLIYRGQCPYARSLIISMIETYKRMLALEYKNHHDVMAALIRLLDELPPGADPPLQVEGF